MRNYLKFYYMYNFDKTSKFEKCSGAILSILFTLLFLSISIYETWIIDTNGGAKDECWQV